MVTLRRTVALAALALVAAACGAAPQDKSAQPTRQPADEEDSRQRAEVDASIADATRADADLVVWADTARAAALRPAATSFGDDHRVTVAVQEIPVEQIRDQLLVTGPEGEGPDVFVGLHDWLGELVAAGVVAPVDLGARADEFAEVALAAVTYDGRTYGVPYGQECVALIRNTDHAPLAPGSWDELAATALQLQERDAVGRGLAMPADPYHQFPLVSALGGYLFGTDATGGYDPSDLGIASPGGVAALSRLGQWADDGLVDPDLSSAEALDVFAAGDAAFAVLGPGVVLSDDHGLAGSAVPYEVTPLPPVDGSAARPFVSAEALMVSAFAADPQLADQFVVDYATTVESQAALAAASDVPPAHLRALEQAAGDPDVAGFAAAAGDGVPLPAVPETASAWGPWAEAMEAVSREGADPHDVTREAAAEIRELIDP